MKVFEIRTDHDVLAAPVYLADNFMTRLRGLMFRKRLAPCEGLLLKNCPAIHCCFMRFAIDAVYLDNEMTVVGKETVKPWRLGGRFAGAKHVLEVIAGDAWDIEPGMHLNVKEWEI